MPVKVSVVIPVFNPGTALDPCIASVLGQSMTPAEYEVILVDDGSTDDTPARLARLAAEHEHVRVETIPNSGWPGKPRNVGTDLARGEYVMYVDQDDVLERRALELMHGEGSANEADVVLGKVISDFRPVNHNVYRHSLARCDIASGQLLSSLTPHKMLRTEFLRSTGIRFAEGRRRLEDQLFMVRAYFAARSATIVADHVCYRYLRRPDGQNAGAQRIEPAGYYGNLREVLDVVDAHTEPGAERDECYRRFLRSEMLGRLGRVAGTAEHDYLTELHTHIRQLMLERFPEAVDDGLGGVLRARAAVVRTGTVADLVEVGLAAARLRVSARIVRLRPRRGSSVEIDVEARLLDGDAPLVLEQGEDGWLLPRSLVGDLVTDRQRRVEPVSEMAGDVIIEHRETLDEWFLREPLEPRLEVDGDRAEIVWSGRAVLAARNSAGGHPLRVGTHDLTVRLQALGLNRGQRLSADGVPESRPLPLLVDRRGRFHRVFRTDHGNLSIEVGAHRQRLTAALRAAPCVRVTPAKVVLDLGVAWTDPPTAAVLVLSAADGSRSVEWRLEPSSPTSTRWTAASDAGAPPLPAGPYQASVRLSPDAEPVALDQQVVVPPQPPPAPAAARPAWYGRLVRGARRVVSDRLPETRRPGSTTDPSRR